MTAFNFLFEEDHVCIAMDTLMVLQDTKQPLNYTSKIYLLPHLDGVMCGTGLGPFVINWYLYIQSSIIAKDIVHLDTYASEALRKLADHFELTDECTATIYHFGWSEQHKRYVGFVYRSVRNFESETLPYGVGTKPPTEIDTFDKLPEDFVKIIEKQKIADEAEPINKKIGIGGDVHFLVMTPGNFNLSKCHRFNDHEECYNKMLKNLA